MNWLVNANEIPSRPHILYNLSDIKPKLTANKSRHPAIKTN